MKSISEYILKIALVIFALSIPTSVIGQSIAILLGLLGLLLYYFTTGRFLKGIDGNFKFIFLGFVSLKMLSVIFSVDLLLSLDGLRKFIGEIIFLFLAIEGIRTKKFLKILIIIMIISTLLESLYGIPHFFITEAKRAKGTLDSNGLGKVLEMLIPIFISIFIYLKLEKRIKILTGITILLSTTLLVLTLCRGAWIGLSCGILLLCLMRQRILLLFFPLFLILLLTVPFLRERFIELVRLSGGIRPQHYKSAFELFLERPILGWGLNTFQKLFEGEERHSHCHNIYLEVLYSGGLLSFLNFILLIVYVLKSAFELHNTTKDYLIKSLSIGMICAIVAMLVHGFFDVSIYGFGGFIFWFATGNIFLWLREEKVAF